MSFVLDDAALTATEFCKLRGKISSLEYAQVCIAQIERYESDVRAWSYFDKQRFLDLARAADNACPDGNVFGSRLWGVPVAVKDIFNTEDMPTEHGSPHFKSYTPGNDARVVTSLLRQGALMAGKTVTAEFAVHHPRETRNPYDLRRTPGTSSSGSAVAVATGMVPVALASQTAGSTIRPASFCGIVGFKPSFGVLPRTAMLKTTDTLDTVGIMARCVDDVGLLFDVMRVRDRNYPVVYREYQKIERLTIGYRPWRLGIVRGPHTGNRTSKVQQCIDDLIDNLSAWGCEIVDFIMPDSCAEAYAHHSRIYNKSLAYYFKREWASDKDGFSPTMSLMIEDGLKIPFAEFQKSVDFQHQMAQSMDDQIANTCDILIDASANDEAPFGHDMNILPDHNMLYTMGLTPAITLPLFKGENEMPVGVQFVARRFDDYKLLYFSKFVEERFLIIKNILKKIKQNSM